ncbi:hypothetical protein [Brevibacterium aurantiacum]|nr:hypothetical protein [Brevibacterium aurantiacum]
MAKETMEPSDDQRIDMFHELARDYLDFVDELGLFGPRKIGRPFTRAENVALSMRTMLERKFITRGEAVHLPAVFKSLRGIASAAEADASAAMNEAEATYKDVYTGASAGRKIVVDGAAIEYRRTWELFAYGRLLHADFDKYLELKSLPENEALSTRLYDSSMIRETIIQTVKYIEESRDAGWLDSPSP